MKHESMRIRNNTCWQCQHMVTTEEKNYRPEKCLCKITKRWGKLERGYYCEKYEYRQWHNAVAADGIPIKNRQPLDYRTEKQWEDSGRQVIDHAAGVEMHATKSSSKTFIYYLIENTKEI